MTSEQKMVGVLGIQFDANSSFKRGPAEGPKAIRAALGSDSANPFCETGVRVWPSNHIADHGDLEVPPVPGSRGPIDLIEKHVRTALTETPRIVIFGGDHAITYPVVQAVAGHHGRISLLHFDAHPDMYPDFDGNRYSHASPMARILEDGLVDRLVQVGIRSYTPAQQEIADRFGVEAYPPWSSGKLPKLEFESPVYVSFDIDVLDPAYAPGVSHPEPGGMSVRQVLDVIAAVKTPGIIGADIVEFNPATDQNNLTAIVAAKIARELLGRVLKESLAGNQ